MINLIPPEGHKAVKHEYILRVGATLCFLFAGVAILLTVALVPTYVLISAQIKNFDLEVKQGDEKEDSFKQAEAEVKITKDIVAQLRTTDSAVLTSSLIEEIQKKAPATVTFKTFSVDAPKGVIEKVQVQGVARTREALAELKRGLESSDMFLKVEVPISDLARDADLPFAVAVTVAPKK